MEDKGHIRNEGLDNQSSFVAAYFRKGSASDEAIRDLCIMFCPLAVGAGSPQSVSICDTIQRKGEKAVKSAPDWE